MQEVNDATQKNKVIQCSKIMLIIHLKPATKTISFATPAASKSRLSVSWRMPFNKVKQRIIYKLADDSQCLLVEK